MKHKSILFLILLALSCGKNDTSPVVEKGLLKNQSITIGGIDRDYHIFIPENPVNAPVVFLFHGNGGSHDDLIGLTGVKAPYKVWLDIASHENLIVVIPNGTLGSSNSRGWNDCRNDALSNPTSNDVEFISDLLDFVAAKYNANTSKVFAVGTSNGGHFSIRLAQEIPNKITAFAAIAAANSVNSERSNSNVKVSALFMNGTDDPIMPYNGGEMPSNRGEVFSTENTVSYWVQRNAANSTPVVVNLPDINTTGGSTVTRYVYQNGGDGTEVALYKVNNGGHTEPSLVERYSSLFLLAVGNQNGDLEMANEVWSFFSDKSK
ncbi:MAG: alpha/beta hydrolase family esterase [Flavobacteriales bacterium]